MLQAIDISTSALLAQRQRMTTLAENIANANTTVDEDGNITPFKRRIVELQAERKSLSRDPGGIGVKYHVEVDPNAKERLVYDPGHRHADKSGHVHYPEISVVREFVNMMEASRAYEMNVSAIDMTKSMAEQTLRIIS